MTTLPNDLAHRRPAEVTRRIILPPHRRATLLIGDTERGVMAELRRRQRRGSIASVHGDLRLLTIGPHAGRYAIPVELIPERPSPRWARVCVAVGTVLLGIAAVIGALIWLIRAMTGAALAGACLTVLGAFLAWLWAKYGRGTSQVTVITSVTVK